MILHELLFHINNYQTSSRKCVFSEPLALSKKIANKHLNVYKNLHLNINSITTLFYYTLHKGVFLNLSDI